MPLELAERVLALYREHYFDFNVRHFHEKLRDEQGLRLNYTWVKLALQGAGLVRKQGRHGVYRRRDRGVRCRNALASGWQLARLAGRRPPLRSAGGAQ